MSELTHVNESEVDWGERELLAYPEDNIISQIKAAKEKVERKFTQQERVNIVKHFEQYKLKRRTCRKFDLTMVELNKVLKEGM